MSEKTVFQKIIDRELPADIVYEDDQCIAFRDIAPAAPTHILVIPKKPIDRIENLTAEDAPVVGHMVYAASQIAQSEGLKNGYRLVFNNGTDGGQSVFHIHLHILGGRQMAWPPG